MKEQRVGLGLLLIGFVCIVGFAAVTAYNDMENETISVFSITSSSFKDEERMPVSYSCDIPEPVSPPLMFENIPEGTVSLALIVVDPDVPTELRPEGEFDHWVLFNIPAGTEGIGEGETVGIPGANTRGETAYAAACPPQEYEPTEHRYIFTLYALDTELSLEEGATHEEVLAASEGHVIAEATLTGRYERVIE